jgi:hypothetical protein
MRLPSHCPTACCVRIVTQRLLISDLLITAFPRWPDAVLSSALKSNVFQQRHGPPPRQDETLEPEACTSSSSDQLNMSGRHQFRILSTPLE